MSCACRPVRLDLAADVIHSFRVPNLAGKQDMIPGRANALLLTARQTGSFRAQCYEFCGLQHARTALAVVVQPAGEFARWRVEQAAPQQNRPWPGRAGRYSRCTSAAPAIPSAAAPPRAAPGPDLAHLAARETLGAGLLPVTCGTLAALIADPQTLKPGNTVPLVPLPADELQALAGFRALLR